MYLHQETQTVVHEKYISAGQAVHGGTFGGVQISHVNPKMDKVIDRCQFNKHLFIHFRVE